MKALVRSSAQTTGLRRMLMSPAVIHPSALRVKEMGTERSISAVWMVYSMRVGSRADETGAQLCLVVSVPSGLSQEGNSRVPRVLLVFKYLCLFHIM